jgi:hypothetical protein
MFMTSTVDRYKERGNTTLGRNQGWRGIKVTSLLEKKYIILLFGRVENQHKKVGILHSRERRVDWNYLVEFPKCSIIVIVMHHAIKRKKERMESLLVFMVKQTKKTRRGRENITKKAIRNLIRVSL